LLRSELYEIEMLVAEILKEAGQSENGHKDQRPDKRLQDVKMLCAGLKKNWTHQLFSTAKDPVIKRYVQFHQAGIIRLSDQVQRIASASKIGTDQKSDKGNFLDELNQELERIISFLRHKFYPYFDDNHRVSIYYCEQQFRLIADYESELEKYNKPEIDPKLIKAYIDSLQDFLNEAYASGMTYREAAYQLNWIRMSDQLLNNITTTTTSSLARAFYKQNLNTLHFANWYKDYWSGQLITATNKREVEILLQNEVSELQNIFVNPQHAMEPALPSIEQILIPFLEALIRPVQKEVKPNGNFLFPLNLSVPQFALFIRVCYKCGCFPMKNVAKIARFFTQHFTTKKQAHISYKSFGHAFYSLDQVTAAVVRDHLQQMLNYVNKTYFP
jgi:hypothetical protein